MPKLSPGPLEFTPDIPLVTLSRYARGMGLGKPVRLPLRMGVNAIVLHTTGRGVLERAQRRQEDPFLTAVHVYTELMDFCGHFVVGQKPCQVAQLVPLHLAAQHVGIEGTARLVPHRPRYQWWHDRWGDRFEHPYGIKAPWAAQPVWGPQAPGALMKLPSANRWTIGVEIVPPEELGAPLSEHCWATLVSMVKVLQAWCKRTRSAMVVAPGLRAVVPPQPDHGWIPDPFEPCRESILTHSDLAPMARTTKAGQPWDLPPHQWTWEEHAHRAGL